FRIEHTVAPLVELFERTSARRREPQQRRASHPPSVAAAPFGAGSSEAAIPANQIAYLIDRWPDKELPFVERELGEMKRRGISIVPFVCELNSAVRLSRSMKRWAP